jgi:hypothetical protein
MRWSVALVALLLACSDAPLAPGAVALDVVLVGPAQGVGALLLNIEGGPVDSVVGTRFYTASAAASGVVRQVLLAGSDLSGAVVRVLVPDGRVHYRAEVREVAQSGSHALLRPDDYALVLVPSAP